MLLGAVILASSYLLLGFHPEKYLYQALGGIIAGNAFFKANPSALVSKLYKKGDNRLDGAFTIYYMAINIGSFIAMIISPYLGKKYGWGTAFMISFFGLLVAIINYYFFRILLTGIDSEAGLKPLNLKIFTLVIVTAVLIAVFSSWLLKHLKIAHLLLYSAVVIALALFLREVIKSTKEERIKLIICLILSIEAVIFFILYHILFRKGASDS